MAQLGAKQKLEWLIAGWRMLWLMLNFAMFGPLNKTQHISTHKIIYQSSLFLICFMDTAGKKRGWSEVKWMWQLEIPKTHRTQNFQVQKFWLGLIFKIGAWFFCTWHWGRKKDRAGSLRYIYMYTCIWLHMYMWLYVHISVWNHASPGNPLLETWNPLKREAPGSARWECAPRQVPLHWVLAPGCPNVGW